MSAAEKKGESDGIQSYSVPKRLTTLSFEVLVCQGSNCSKLYPQIIRTTAIHTCAVLVDPKLGIQPYTLTQP